MTSLTEAEAQLPRNTWPSTCKPSHSKRLPHTEPMSCGTGAPRSMRRYRMPMRAHESSQAPPTPPRAPNPHAPCATPAPYGDV